MAKRRVGFSARARASERRRELRRLADDFAAAAKHWRKMSEDKENERYADVADEDQPTARRRTTARLLARAEAFEAAHLATRKLLSKIVRRV